MPDADLYATLSAAAETIETASQNTTIDWLTYKSTSPTTGATVNLTNADFNNGTLRITTGNCVFKLTENISIQSGTSPDFFPTESTEFPFPPYQLGWFAGITVETTDGVVIDLNGFRIEQTKLFALQQRFYAIIELGDQPFLENQGPSQFGPLVPCSNVTIKNGTLGRSSHHGIHSPGSATNILIENLQIENFEVGGIHLNGASSTVIKNCNIGSIRTDVPVIGTYSQCRFIRPFLTAIDQSLTLPFKNGSITGAEILTDLDNVLSAVFTNISNNKPGNYQHPECSFMVNPDTLTRNSPLIDQDKTDCYQPAGGAYGIVLNRSGVAVNGFLLTQPTGSVGNNNILVDSVCVSTIESNTIEVVGVSNPNGGGDGSYGGGGSYMVGPVGDIFRIDDLTNSDGTYKSTPLSNAQLFVALRGTPGSIGTTNIPTDTSSGIMGWALSGDKTKGTTNISTIITYPPTNNLYRLYNGDAMAHACKGNIGVWLQGGDDIEVKDCDITKITQNSVPSLGKVSDYSSTTFLSNPSSTLPYYGGATTRGIAVSSCKNIAINTTNINMLTSLTGNVIGVDYIGVNTGISTNNISVGQTKCPNNDQGGANQLARTCPIRVRNTTSSTSITNSGKCPAQLVDSA